MRNLKKLTIDGNEIEEGYILNKWFKTRFDNNQNILAVVVGKTGSGKSWSCGRICENWYRERFNKPFPIENVCFSLKAAGERIKEGNLEKGEFLIIEEAGVIANALDFQNKIVKFFHFILQSFRCKNIGILFNLPMINLLNKTARLLAHAIFMSMGIDSTHNIVVFKTFYLQTNSLTGKTYTKYLRLQTKNHVISIKRILISKPSDNFIREYEKRKQEFVDNLIGDFVEINKKQQSQTIEKQKEQKEQKKTKLTSLQEAILKLHGNGITNKKQIASILGVEPRTVYNNFNLLYRLKIFDPKYMEKAEHYLTTKNPPYNKD